VQELSKAEKPLSIVPEQIIEQQRAVELVEHEVVKQVVNEEVSEAISVKKVENVAKNIAPARVAAKDLPVVENLPTVQVFESDIELPNPKLEDIETAQLTIELKSDESHDNATPESAAFGLEVEVEQPDYELLAEALPFIVFEQEEVASEDSDTIEKPPLVEQLAQFIETLEPTQAEEAGAILDVIMEKIQLFYEEDSAENQEILEEELELICARMLVCMGVKPTPETVKHLLLALKKEYLEQLELTEKEIYDEGTHERKQFSQMLHDLPDVVHPLSGLLGRYILQLAA
jgi:hypothetical protein